MDLTFENARKGNLGYFMQSDGASALVQYVHATDEDQRTLLHNAVTSGNAELVEYLLQQGTAQTVSMQDDEGWSPLHSAASCGYDRIAELLLMNGADVYSQTTSGRVALHYAASKGHDQIVRLLLSHGASVNGQDSVGFTPLHRAAASGQLQVVRMLVDEASATIDIEDNYRKTPIVIAAESQNDSVVLFLVARGANLNVTLDSGKTITEQSERLRRCVEDLLEERVDIDDLIRYGVLAKESTTANSR